MSVTIDNSPDGVNKPPRSPMTRTAASSAGFTHHLGALMRKNIVLKKQHALASACEVMIPILFIAGLILIWSVSAKEEKPGQNFVADPWEPVQPSDIVSGMICLNRTFASLYPAARIRTCNTTDEQLPTFECFYGDKVARPGHVCAPFGGRAFLGAMFDFMGKPFAVPTLDEMLIWKWAGESTISWFERFRFVSEYVALTQGSRLLFVDSIAARGFINRSLATSAFFASSYDGPFESVAAAMNFTLTFPHTGRAMAVIEMDMSPTRYHVVIHQNRSGTPTTLELIRIAESQGLGGMTRNVYLAGGLLSLQQAIDAYYYTEVLNTTQPPRRVVQAAMPFPSYVFNSFYTGVGDSISFVMVLAFLFPVSQLVKRIVTEKETRLREAMMIMGLGSGSFYASWLITYVTEQFVCSLVIAVLCKATMLKKSDFFLVFFLFFLFGISAVCLSGLMATFFSRSRTAALLAPAVFFITAIPSFALPVDSPASVTIPLALLSPTAFGQAARLVFRYEIASGAGPAEFGAKQDVPNIGTMFLMLIIDIVLYVALLLYLDKVLPSEWGTRLHPLFCFGFGGHDNHDDDKNVEISFSPVATSDFFEPRPDTDTPSIRFRRVVKSFKRDDGQTFRAVDGLSWDLFEGDVTVLLGHNGAGKTTTINCLTGMLDITSGDCEVYGQSVRRELPRVRQSLGLCPQHNILWDEMSCIDHLLFYAKLKGVDGPEAVEAAEEMLRNVALEAKRDAMAASLSGGQKRKLSVACAFMGNARVVLLDEPTAGMDVAARRSTWELIKTMAAGRTVIMTTHYLDEADILGNTVAIMSHGVLKCAGSPMFLKSRLGVGYTLTLATQGGTEAARKQLEAIQAVVPAAQPISSSGGELTVRLPMAETHSFPDLLRVLEEDPATKNYGIGVTTLEEIFLGIGLDDEERAAAQKKDDVDSKILDRAKGDRTVPLWEEHETQRGNEAGFCQQMGPLLLKRLRSARRDTRTVALQIVMPAVCILAAVGLANVSFFGNAPQIALRGDTYPEPTVMPYGGACGPYPANFAQPNTALDFRGDVASAAAMSTYLLSTHNAHKGLLRLGAFFCDASVTTQLPVVGNVTRRYDVFFSNESYRHSPPIAVADAHAYEARRLTNNSGLEWYLGLDMLPLDEYANTFVTGLNAFIFGMLVVIPFTFIPSTFVGWVVRERECKAKHLQLVSGLDYVLYWISTFLFDIMSYFVTIVGVFIIFAIFDREEYLGNGKAAAATILVFLLYGLAGTTGSYALSFAFDSHSTAQNVVMFVNFVVGFFCVVLVFFLTFNESTDKVGKALKWILRIHPAFCLGDAIINIASLSLIRVFTADGQNALSMDIVGWDLVYLAIEVPVFAAITLVLDHPARQLRQHQLTDKLFSGATAEDAAVLADADVAAEAAAIAAGERKDDVVQVQHLRKVYGGGTVAVKDLTFGVRRGEIFGLLGSNGAGKTSTMAILTGEFPPTRGTASVAGVDVVADPRAARRHIGFCPQFDAILELLTPVEHIELYAGLRGLSPAATKSVTELLLTLCELREYRTTLAGQLSGGNKRKLSVAIALVGGPEVVVLDEASAGMDPVSRRGLWTAIERISHQCSVVLTTHHLEEVEVLATRLTIMAEGEMKCLGTLPHLKSKFGTGFELSLRIDSSMQELVVQEEIKRRIPGAELHESRNQKLTFGLPPDALLSKVFEVVEDAKADKMLGITDYSVAQTSIEQVFLRVTGASMAASQGDE